MRAHHHPLFAEKPEQVSMSQAENDDLRRNCISVIENGGEAGSIASEILRINEKMLTLIEKVDAFIKR